VIDVATGASPEEQAATEFFTAAARNLQQVGHRAGVQRIVVVSIIGIDRFTGGYGAAKQAHERATLSGPIPARILRAASSTSSSRRSWTGAGRTGRATCRRCTHSWSPPRPWPRRSPIWPPGPSRRPQQDPTGHPSRGTRPLL